MGGSVHLGKRLMFGIWLEMPFSTRLTQGNHKSPLPRRHVLIQTMAELLPAQDLRYFLDSDMRIFMARLRKEKENLYYTTQGTKQNTYQTHIWKEITTTSVGPVSQ